MGGGGWGGCQPGKKINSKVGYAINFPGHKKKGASKERGDLEKRLIVQIPGIGQPSA